MSNAFKNKIFDKIFNYLGIFCTLIGLVVLAIFLINIVVEGIARIDFDFLTSLPSRKAEKAKPPACLNQKIAINLSEL